MRPPWSPRSRVRVRVRVSVSVSVSVRVRVRVRASVGVRVWVRPHRCQALVAAGQVAQVEDDQGCAPQGQRAQCRGVTAPHLTWVRARLRARVEARVRFGAAVGFGGSPLPIG